jgi:hypothetical protein
MFVAEWCCGSRFKGFPLVFSLLITPFSSQRDSPFTLRGGVQISEARKKQKKNNREGNLNISREKLALFFCKNHSFASILGSFYFIIILTSQSYRTSYSYVEPGRYIDL